MKKFIITFIAIAFLSAQAFAYDFSYTYQGQTLYYTIVDGNAAAVTNQNSTGSSYTNLTGALTIPESVTYNGATYAVTSIGDEAFWGCSGLTSVTIPNSVTAIGGGAFGGCSGLTSINIPNSVTAIGGGAFGDCSGLTSVVIPNSVISIGNYAFAGCSGLTSVTIPNSVTSIGLYAFYGCSGLTSVTIPNSVTSIGEYAFWDCSGLTSVTIGNSVTSIGSHAFQNCSGLTSVTIGNSVTSIGSHAFYGCSGLTSVTISNSVTSIGGSAFKGCTGLTEIHSLSQVAPSLGENAFSGVSSTIPVYIPCGSSGSYYGRWNYFSNLIEEEAFTFNAESADNNMGTVQILTMPTCTAPNAVLYASANSGYRFDHWSTGSTSNPYTLTVTSDTIITAYFVSDGGTEGIGDVDGSTIHVYTDGGNIIVNGAEGEKVQVFDMVGRPVGTQSLPTGVYMVKVGTLPARRVVVIR